MFTVADLYIDQLITIIILSALLCIFWYLYLFSPHHNTKYSASFFFQTYAWKLGRNVIMQIERGAMGTKCQMSGMHFQTLVGWR